MSVNWVSTASATTVARVTAMATRILESATSVIKTRVCSVHLLCSGITHCMVLWASHCEAGVCSRKIDFKQF